jgi:hypothetical protein
MIVRGLKHLFVGTSKRSELDYEIEKVKMLRGRVDPNDIEYTSFTKLSPQAFNYYWFGLPYDVYN